ncbi:retrovirus-related pol polyprotein from transposon 17.6 [Tanacetum coccineum]
MAGFPCLDKLAMSANSRSIFDGMMVYIKRETKIVLEFAANLHNLGVQFIDRTNDRKLFISELEGVPTSLMSYNCCQFPHQGALLRGQERLYLTSLVPKGSYLKENNKEDGNGGIAGIASTSCTTNPKMQVDDVIKEGRSKAAGVSFASMFSEPWTLYFVKTGVVTKVPVWVKLYNVLVVAYSEDGLSLIATQIGKPIMLDAFTSSMCVDSWGQISFARALIEIDANSDLKKEVKMAIPVNEDDWSGYISEVIRVEYELKPPHCLDCKIFGHNYKKCPNKVIVTDDNVDNSTRNNDGFTEVANDKQDKKKSADVKASSSHVCGDKSTPISNAFSVLNSEEGAECGDSFPTNDVGSAQNDEGVQNPSLGMEEVVVECEKDSLWSKFKAAKEASKSNPRSTSDFEEESDKDEVYFPNKEYTSGMGGGFSLKEDDLDCYDGYEAQVFDMPGYDIRLNSRRRK